MSVLIVGCGDIGRRLAQRLRARGVAVRGLVRGEATRSALQAEGIAAQCCDLDVQAPALAEQEVYWFAPPPEQGVADQRLRRALQAWGGLPRRLVYISTSAVYGDCGGRWIDETAPLRPKSDRGRRRLDAESALHEAATLGQGGFVILRVPGIYGPGRLPLARLRSGLPVVREEESPYTNRIHSEDLAEAAWAAMDRGLAGAAYNVSDGRPTTMSDYFVRCARLLGLPEPPRISLVEAQATFTPAMRSFLDESKRLLNRRLIEDLGVRLRYPDLDAGLPSCIEPQDRPS